MQEIIAQVLNLLRGAWRYRWLAVATAWVIAIVGWVGVQFIPDQYTSKTQVYVDTGVIIYALPKAEFYRYLQRIVDAGFGRRVMFGSDQMIWPGIVPRAIQLIEDAPFLTAAQKRDILYNNAARFLRIAAPP